MRRKEETHNNQQRVQQEFTRERERARQGEGSMNVPLSGGSMMVPFNATDQ
jgi:hypothetical protein